MKAKGLLYISMRLRHLSSILFASALLCCSIMFPVSSLHAQEKGAFRGGKATSRTSDKIYCCDRFPYEGNDSNAYIITGQVFLKSGVRPYVPVISTNCSDRQYPNPALTSELAAAANPAISLSMNANFFWWDRPNNIHELPCLRAIGLAVSEYKIISLPGEGINEQITNKKVLPDSILFYDSELPQIAIQPKSGYRPPEGVRTAVSGILIVNKGEDISDTDRVHDAAIRSTSNEPRTAIALDESRSILYFAIAIGKAMSGYEGITLPDLAKFFRDYYDAYTVLNLDGAGSSALNYYYYNTPEDYFQVASPPDDVYPVDTDFSQYRPVPINLAFVTDESTAVPNRIVAGTPLPQDTVFRGTTIDAFGSFSFINDGSTPITLKLEAKDKITLHRNSAVIVSRREKANSSGSFQAIITK